MNSRVSVGVALAVGLVSAQPVWAQGGVQATLVPSAAVACLQPAAAQRGVPEFPFEAWKGGERGEVVVRLEFGGPDRPPRVRVLKQDGPDDFAFAVKSHVASWRVPCLPAGERATLDQAFRFDSSLRQARLSAPVDAADATRRAAMKCLSHVSGDLSFDYPQKALNEGVQGQVLAALKFTSPDQPPEVRLVAARPAAETLRLAVERQAPGLRMPCLTGEHVETVLTYQFFFENAGRTTRAGLKPLTLQQLLPVVRGIRAATLQLDTRSMDCPFDVSWQYRKPNFDNEVSEKGATLAAREPMLKWLKGIELELPASALDAVYGDTTTITVPCVQVDLKPQTSG
jgi:hypothetical protein